jgi:hypothetical protein
MSRVRREGASRSANGLLVQLPPGTDPPAGDGGAASADREIWVLLETALSKLQEMRSQT